MARPVAAPKTNPTKAQRWPNKASAVADEVQIRLNTIGKRAGEIDARHKRIDTLAMMTVDAVKSGNSTLAQQLAMDIRAAALSARQCVVDVRSEAATASDVLARARRGEYEQ